jgi:uncharacterized damage-inducible protein DinB
MSEEISILDAFYNGWQTYQGLLTTALEPLNQVQLAYKSAPHLRSIEEIATHMIGARARWFGEPTGDADEQLAIFAHYDRRGGPERSALEIIEGLKFTLDHIQQSTRNWSEAVWQAPLPGERYHGLNVITRQWIVWHLIEHDLHHGGEISLTMGMHGLKAPEL